MANHKKPRPPAKRAEDRVSSYEIRGYAEVHDYRVELRGIAKRHQPKPGDLARCMFGGVLR